MPSHGLVDAVVHNLIDKMVQTLYRSVADVHGRSLAARAEPLHDLDLLCCILSLNGLGFLFSGLFRLFGQ